MSRYTTLLVVLALVAALGFLGARAHPLVSMTNDHQGRPAFPTPEPGDTRLVGGVRLGNDGALPYTYEVGAVVPLPTGSALEIIREEDGATLYTGRLTQGPVSLGTLEPGRSATLKLVVTQPSGNIAIPTLVWSARGVVPSFGWLAAVAGGWLAIAALTLVNLLLFIAWRREVARSRALGVRVP